MNRVIVKDCGGSLELENINKDVELYSSSATDGSSGSSGSSGSNSGAPKYKPGTPVYQTVDLKHFPAMLGLMSRYFTKEDTDFNKAYFITDYDNYIQRILGETPLFW